MSPNLVVPQLAQRRFSFIRPRCVSDAPSMSRVKLRFKLHFLDSFKHREGFHFQNGIGVAAQLTLGRLFLSAEMAVAVSP
jgi:hypothetical protein